MVKHGGAPSLYRLVLLRNIDDFFEKHHIFKATGGAIMGGRMEGRKNGGANGWAPKTPVSQFAAKNMRFLQ